jgi:phage terminase small subunit
MTDATPKKKVNKGGNLRGSKKGKPVNVRDTNRTDEGLTLAQEAYCRSRAMGMSMQEASIAVGLHNCTGRNWEKENIKVCERIKDLTRIATENAIIKTGLNREWVISRLMTVVDRCMQAEPVLDKEGSETGQYRFDASGANQALKMLGDTMGLFKPAEKKEDEYANLTDADLARIAQDLASQVGLLESPARIEASAGSGQIIEVQAISQAN